MNYLSSEITFSNLNDNSAKVTSLTIGILNKFSHNEFNKEIILTNCNVNNQCESELLPNVLFFKM